MGMFPGARWWFDRTIRVFSFCHVNPSDAVQQFCQ
jgi:hypothetical protein